MALKFKCKSKDEIPAGLEVHYVERDGAWVLDAEGAADKAKVEEFRATNVALMKERDELKKRFEGIDPDGPGRTADAAETHPRTERPTVPHPAPSSTPHRTATLP